MQTVPHVVLAWLWNSVQCNRWARAQHRNVLELTTLLNWWQCLCVRSCLCQSERVRNRLPFGLFPNGISATLPDGWWDSKMTGCAAPHFTHLGIGERRLEAVPKSFCGCHAHCQYAVHDLNNSSSFDVALVEYINQSWLDDDPYQTALDAVRLRGSTTTAKLYLRKWQRTRDVQHATPVPVEVMQAMVAGTCKVRDWSLTGATLVGLLGAHIRHFH